MREIRRAEDRGHADHGWLRSAHTFSFGGYMDPRFRGFRDLLVINDDRVAGGRGFGTHPHTDMEIVSYVLSGALEHRDSMGNGEVLHAGEVQRMSAGTGVRHSEFNHSRTDEVHFLQMWVMPQQKGLEPSYEQKHFPPSERRGRWQPLVSPSGEEGSLKIHQDVRLLGTVLESGDRVALDVDPGRFGWLHVARGRVQLADGTELESGDGLAFDGDEQLELMGVDASEVLVWDLS
jgi:redox-sensitive bicupin YhaK (pirin superfamily)